ncbi:MAG: NAD(P)-binding domain-containing protein [Nitriliruptoraceae bacterium]
MSTPTFHEHHLDVDAVVIGAGPAGLAAAKALSERGVTYRHFEKGSMVGGLWRIDNDNGGAAAYATLHLNSSRPRTSFPSHPMPDDWPDYPSHDLVASYLQDLADRFGLTERITFNAEVVAVEPLDGDGPPGADGWRVATATGETVTAHAVLVANGHHGVPKVPELPGTFTGTAFHSHDYREPTVFDGQRVLVIGVGNSGMDIACDAAPLATQVLLSTRHGVHVIPKYVFGKPVDQLSSPLTAHLPFRVERKLYELLMRASVGRPQDRGLPTPDHRLLGAHPTVSSRLYDLVGHGDIEVVGDVASLEGDKVRFVDGRVEPVDVLVYATGYQVSLPFLAPEVLEVRDNELPLYQRVVAPERPGLYLLGFIQTVGANIALMEHQAEWVGDLLTGAAVLPPVERMRDWIRRDRRIMAKRYLRSERHTMQVDYWRYIRAIEHERQRSGETDLRVTPRAAGTVGSDGDAAAPGRVSDRVSAALRQVSERAATRTGR